MNEYEYTYKDKQGVDHTHKVTAHNVSEAMLEALRSTPDACQITKIFRITPFDDA